MLKRLFSYIKVSSIQEWKSAVLDSNVPVLVHFHTEWSAASNNLKKSLSPEHQTQSYNIVELDADELQTISKILDIKTSPTLYLINQGKSLQKLEGDIKPKTLKSLIYTIKLLSKEWTEFDLASKLINEAYSLYELKDYDQAIETYKSALKLQKPRERFEVTVIVGLVRCNYERGDYESTEFYINDLMNRHKNTLAVNEEVSEELKGILKKIGDKRSSSQYLMYKAEVDDANRDIFDDPYNEEKHAKLAMIHYDYGFIEEAIEKSLQVTRSEGSLTGFGYKVLMEIFKDLGHDNVYVQKYKPQLDLMQNKFRSNT